MLRPSSVVQFHCNELIAYYSNIDFLHTFDTKFLIKIGKTQSMRQKDDVLGEFASIFSCYCCVIHPYNKFKAQLNSNLHFFQLILALQLLTFFWHVSLLHKVSFFNGMICIETKPTF